MADLLCLLPKDEEHCINDIGLAAAVWADHRGEALQAPAKVVQRDLQAAHVSYQSLAGLATMNEDVKRQELH